MATEISTAAPTSEVSRPHAAACRPSSASSASWSA